MRRARVVLAWVFLLTAVPGWPISALTLAKDEPPFILGLSWLAIILASLEFLTSSQIHEENEDRVAQRHNKGGNTMPSAVVNLSAERFVLKSIPVGEGEEPAYVDLRRMPYGAKLGRNEAAAQMSMKMKGKRRTTEDDDMTIKMMQRQTAFLDFSQCIVGHNLTDDSGKDLDFTRISDMEKLDPRVGEEIAALIDKMNNFEDDGELGN